MNFKRCGKKWSWPASNYSTNIFLDELRKTTNRLGLRADGGTLNPPEYETGELGTVVLSVLDRGECFSFVLLSELQASPGLIGLH
jgi:hypothetical protein